jgi:hypothetical protein
MLRGLGNQPAEIDKVWLKSEYRALVIKQGIEKAGSLNGLGRELGYRSRIHPGWSVLQILLGRQAFPVERMKKLAVYIDEPYEEMMSHQTKPKLITPQNTKDALIAQGLWCYLPR